MIPGLIAAITSLGTLFTKGFTKYQEVKQEKIQSQIRTAELTSQLMLAKNKAELELGKTQIKATSSWFKHVTFFLWFGPFVMTTIFPEYGVVIFKNWQLMPEWYAQSCVAIMFCVWGIQVSKDYIANIFSSAGHFFKKRRQEKFNQKIFYDTLRSTKGPISQYEVEVLNKALENAKEFEKDDE